MSAQKVGAGTPISLADPGLHEANSPSATASETLAGLVDAHLAAELARGLARGTVAYRRIYLAQLVAWLCGRGITMASQITPAVLENYLVHLRGRVTEYNRKAPSPLSVKTLAAEASVLRSLFAWLAKRRVVLFDPAMSLVLGDRSQPLPKTVLTESEVQALLATPGRDAVGLRDRAILETLYSTGLRRAELVGLDLYDLDAAGGLVRVRQGKGGKDRYVPVGAHALEALRRYIHHARPELAATSKESALFVALISGRRLTRAGLGLAVRRHADATGIPKRVTPHVLRHTCATHLLQNGADLRHVQAILGHASIATTQVYTRVAVEDLVLVHRRSHPRRSLKVVERRTPEGVSSGGSGRGRSESSKP